MSEVTAELELDFDKLTPIELEDKFRQMTMELNQLGEDAPLDKLRTYAALCGAVRRRTSAPPKPGKPVRKSDPKLNKKSTSDLLAGL